MEGGRKRGGREGGSEGGERGREKVDPIEGEVEVV
jgi:hypothetical protein